MYVRIGHINSSRTSAIITRAQAFRAAGCQDSKRKLFCLCQVTRQTTEALHPLDMGTFACLLLLGMSLCVSRHAATEEDNVRPFVLQALQDAKTIVDKAYMYSRKDTTALCFLQGGPDAPYDPALAHYSFTDFPEKKAACLILLT
ncbi:eosinophil peroxidase-like [Arapaima gigas]